MAQLGKFQMTAPKSFSGLATKSSMAALFGRSPQKASNMMIQLLAQYRGKSLEMDLMSLGVVNFARDDEYTWDLIGSSNRNIELLEARVNGSVQSASSDNLGANGAQFDLVFGEDWFNDGQTIVGEKPDLYPIQIVKKSIEGINNAVYTCVMLGGVTGGIPAEEVVAGKKFSGEGYAVSSELSRERMGGNVTTPFAMRGEFSTIRYGHKVTGTADKYQVKVGIPTVDKSGKVIQHNAWMPHVQYQIEEDFSDMKHKLLMYGRSNRDQSGLYLNKDHKSLQTLTMGAGFREQMEVSNTIFYNTFSIKLIEDLLLDLSEAKLGFNDRKFIMKTGNRGAAQFSKAVSQIASGWSIDGNLQPSNGNASVVSKTTSNLHSNALRAGFQFVEWLAPNGVILRVEVDPIYDDRVRNKIMHPLGGVAESYRYDIYYVGGKGEGNGNMKIAKVDGLYDRRGFSSGPFGNPFLGTTTSNYSGTDEDSAKMHLQCTLGAILYDPSKTVSLIPSMLQ